MANKEDLKQSFEEVRKAYRLLFGYQKKILDLMSFIQAYFGLQHSGIWQKFSSKLPKEEKINLNMWAWDWLPMYFSEFHFKIDDKFAMSILLVSDSGYFDKNANIQFGDYQKKLNPNEFETVENSETRLIFILEKHENEANSLIGDGWWHSKELFDKKVGAKGNAIFKTYNLEEFCNQKATEKILEELSKFANSNKFKLKKIDL